MSKHHRTAGKDYETFTVGDKTYTLRPLTVGTYAELESYVRSRRPDPLALAADAAAKVPPSQQPAMWDAAFRIATAGRTVSAEEMMAFETSPMGIAWKFWQLVKRDHPEIDSAEKAMALLEQIGREKSTELIMKMQIASGEEDVKNSDGLAAEAETASHQAGQ